MAGKSEGETRPFPPPFGPATSLRRQLDEPRASRLTRAWDRARLYAYPKKHPDLDALERGAPEELLLAPARWGLLVAPLF